MKQDAILKIFKDRGALLQGHFKLTSGLHSDSYLQCAQLLQYARDADRLGAKLAECFGAEAREKPITAVVSPAIGGIVLGHVVARSLNARAIFAERVDGRFTLRRGFALAPGEQVLVVEDVITTGGSVREIAQMVESMDAQVVGFGALADRGEIEVQFPAPKHTLLRLPLVTYQPESCPMCEQGIPLVKPGSRPEPACRQAGPAEKPS
ncbi:MAG: orotate phosphoribosyltransferase [Elusimicrobiota bacterium]